jgi:glutaredoxin
MAFFSRVFLPFLLLFYIAVETYLKLNASSLCVATGCKLAGELLRFDPLYLNYFGLASVLFLLVLGYFSLKSQILERIFFMVLYSAIAFEATILGYQFLANPEPCMFCLGIFSSLSLIALLSHTKDFPLIASVALSVFLGLSTLAITKNKSFIVENGSYLIQSKSCPHCKTVKTYFAKHDINYTPISVKEASARAFLKFAGVTTIPVLVTKDASGISLLIGDANILHHFQEKEPTSSSQKLPQSSSSSTLPTDLFRATSEPGCAITITETPACENDKKGTH